jgi:hypothetical protein
MLGFIITQKCFKSDRMLRLFVISHKQILFSKMFLKLTKVKKIMKNTLLIAILILCLLFPLYRIFSFYKKKESISGQNLIDNLLNFGLIILYQKKFNSTTCRLSLATLLLIHLWPLKNKNGIIRTRNTS